MLVSRLRTEALTLASPPGARLALVYLLSGLVALLAGGCLSSGSGGTLTPATKRIEGVVQLPSGAPWAGATLTLISFSSDQTL
ncbi:MAG TPA: hypothetical protein VFK80_00760, partial [Limnochordia bacterium]|nr:hypothetical protein [Limnochordia bacterium]